MLSMKVIVLYCIVLQSNEVTHLFEQQIYSIELTINSNTDFYSLPLVT